MYAGAVHVFTENAGVWNETQTIARREGGFGCTIAADGDTLVVGRTASYPGHGGGVYVYTLSGGQWAFQQQLIADDIGTQAGKQRRYGY